MEIDSQAKDNFINQSQNLTVFQKAKLFDRLVEEVKKGKYQDLDFKGLMTNLSLWPSQKHQCHNIHTNCDSIQQDFSEFKGNYDFNNCISVPEIQADHGTTLLTRKTIPDLEKLVNNRKDTVFTQEDAYLDMENRHMKYLNYDRQTLLNCFYRMFEKLDLIKKFNIKPENLRTFLEEVGEHYTSAPFHNMTHAFNVTHVMYWIINPDRNSVFSSEVFNDTDKLCMILGCIGHDLEHPGLGNTYFKKSNHVLSQIVNGKSILENYHCFALFHILETSNLLSGMEFEKMSKVTSTIQELILNTDMALHFSLIQLHNSKKVEDPYLMTGNQSIVQDKNTLMSVLLHACDISNPTMNFQDFREWGLRITQEFDDIFAAEQDLQVQKGTPPPVGFMKYVDYKTFSGSQIGFSKTFVLQLWEILANIDPIINDFVDQIKSNIKQYGIEVTSPTI